VHGGHNGSADIVHVENRRESVEAGRVELVAVHHGDVGEGLEVSLWKRDGHEDVDSDGDGGIAHMKIIVLDLNAPA
jgi:hypothetical protein